MSKDRFDELITVDEPAACHVTVQSDLDDFDVRYYRGTCACGWSVGWRHIHFYSRQDVLDCARSHLRSTVGEENDG